MDATKLRNLYEKALNFPVPDGIQYNLSGFLKVSELCSRSLPADAFAEAVNLVTSFHKEAGTRVLMDGYNHAMMSNDGLYAERCINLIKCLVGVAPNIEAQVPKASQVVPDPENHSVAQTGFNNNRIYQNQSLTELKSNKKIVSSNRPSGKTAFLKRKVTAVSDISSDSEPEFSYSQDKNYNKFTKSKRDKAVESRDTKENKTLQSYVHCRRAVVDDSEDSDSLFKKSTVKRLALSGSPQASGLHKKSPSKRYNKGQPKQPGKSCLHDNTDFSHSDSEAICTNNHKADKKKINNRSKSLDKYASKTKRRHSLDKSESSRREAFLDSGHKKSKGNSRKKECSALVSGNSDSSESSSPVRGKQVKRNAKKTSLSESESFVANSKKTIKGKRRSKSLEVHTSFTPQPNKAKSNKNKSRKNSLSDVSPGTSKRKRLQNKKDQLPSRAEKQLKTTNASSRKTSSKKQSEEKNTSTGPSPDTSKAGSSKFINRLKELESTLLADTPDPLTNDKKNKKAAKAKSVAPKNKKCDSKKPVGSAEKPTPKQSSDKASAKKPSAKARASQKSAKGLSKNENKSGALKVSKKQAAAKKDKKPLEPKQNAKKRATGKSKSCDKRQTEDSALIEKEKSDEIEENAGEKEKSLESLMSSEGSDSEIEPVMGTMSVCLNSIKKHLPRQVGTATPPLRAFLTSAVDRVSDASAASSDEASLQLDDRNVVKRMAKVNRIKRKDQGGTASLPTVEPLNSTPQSLRKMVKLKNQLETSDLACSSFSD